MKAKVGDWLVIKGTTVDRPDPPDDVTSWFVPTLSGIHALVPQGSSQPTLLRTAPPLGASTSTGHVAAQRPRISSMSSSDSIHAFIDSWSSSAFRLTPSYALA